MSVFKLTSKKILITGASSGIGAQSASVLAEQGATLILSGRNREKLEEIKSKLIGNNHQIIPADLTHPEELKALVEKIPEIDGILQSSGIVKPFPLKFVEDKHIQEMFNINFNAPVLLVSKLLKAKKIIKGASLIFMSSISSKVTHKGGALYTSSKAGINAYSRAIAIEHAHQKIRSNVILAGMVKTAMFDEAEKAVSKEAMDKHGEEYPLGFGEPIDIANTVVFLLSDASKWITGTEIVMDGGLTAGR